MVIKLANTYQKNIDIILKLSSRFHIWVTTQSEKICKKLCQPNSGDLWVVLSFSTEPDAIMPQAFSQFIPPHPPRNQRACSRVVLPLSSSCHCTNGHVYFLFPKHASPYHTISISPSTFMSKKVARFYIRTGISKQLSQRNQNPSNLMCIRFSVG